MDGAIANGSGNTADAGQNVAGTGSPAPAGTDSDPSGLAAQVIAALDQAGGGAAPATENAGGNGNAAAAPEAVVDAAAKTPVPNSVLDAKLPEQTAKPAAEAGAEKTGEDPAGSAKPADVDPADVPITDFSKVDLGLDKDVVINQQVLDSFGKVAVESGLTPRQAQALAKWQAAQENAYRESMIEAGIKEVVREWGDRAEANKKAANELVAQVDRLVGGQRFSKALGASGACCHGGFVLGLAAMARLLGEDSLGAKVDAATANSQETALEGLEAAWREARARGSK